MGQPELRRVHESREAVFAAYIYLIYRSGIGIRNQGKNPSRLPEKFVRERESLLLPFLRLALREVEGALICSCGYRRGTAIGVLVINGSSTWIFFSARCLH